MSFRDGIINHLISNTIEIYFTDNDPEHDPEHVEPKITEANIVSESMKLKQAICDGDELRFGGCIASQFFIDLLRTSDREFENELSGRWIAVKLIQTYADPDELIYPSDNIYPSGSLYPGRAIGAREQWIFSGYIDSAKASKTDKNVINIVAYDALAKLHEADATNYLYLFFKTSSGTLSLDRMFTEVLSSTHNRVLTIGTTNTIRVRNEQYYNGTTTRIVSSFCPSNEFWMTQKDTISFGMLLRYICEVFGVFGLIIPDSGKGTFTFKMLTGTTETYDFYEKLEAEDYQSTGYTDFSFSVSGGDRTGKSVIHGGLSSASDDAVDKVYDFSENILILQPYTTSGQGRTSTEFDFLINNTDIGARLAMNNSAQGHTGQCAFSEYQPLTATLDGRPWVSVGDPIEILVNKTDVNGDYIVDEQTGEIEKETVQTYVFSRTLTGIQALTDYIEVKGAR